MNNNEPLISCLCITRNKPHMLSRAMRCFFAQSYSNKELVIVYESDDPLTIALLKDPAINCHPHILLLEVNASPKVSLGNLRNLGIEASNGDFI